jgi:hypothetical protein
MNFSNLLVDQICAFPNSSGAGGDSGLTILREPVVALGNAEHDEPRLWGGQMLGQHPRFLCAVAPVCHVIK